MKNVIYFFAFGFGFGLIPFAPGTWGTAIGAVIYFFCLQNLPIEIYLIILLLSFLFGIWLCRVTSHDFSVHDHPAIVWDEMVGFWITMFMAPKGLLWMIIGFILFRLFDITKPWPIRWIDRHVKGGLGIMLDDVLAGVFAWVCLQGLMLLQPLTP